MSKVRMQYQRDIAKASAAITAHLVVVAAEDDRTSELAALKRDSLSKRLSNDQRGYVVAIAHALERMAGRKPNG